MQGCGAVGAAWGINNGREGQGDGGLVHQAQRGQRVADLLALVEARAADDAVGQAQRDEALLELAGLEAGAHEDGGLGERLALPLARLDLVADPARLLLAVPHAPQHDALALVERGPQGLAEPALVLRYEARGGGEDVRGRAVVLLEADDLRAREVALEAQDVADLGAAPGIDRLVVVADAAEVAVALREQAQPEI